MTSSPTVVEQLQTAANALSEAQAEQIIAIDVSGNLPFTDAFLLATADNPRHLRATVSALESHMREEAGLSPVSVEGGGDSTWLIADYGDIAVHLFLPEARSFYALDKLWLRSPRINLELPDAPAGAPAPVSAPVPVVRALVD